MCTPANNRAAALAAAISYLEGTGFQVRDHDWNQPDGSLDIVATDHGTLVACVLTIAAGRRYPTPLNVTATAARDRQRRLAVRWLAEHRERPGRVRVDVIGLLPETPGGFTIEHVRGVA